VDEPPVEAPPVGTRLDAYRLTGVLGKGGMSTVYLAEEAGTGRKVALKVLEPRLVRDEEFRQRFLRESEYATLRHPNVVKVHACGESGGLLYMAMDYIEGTDLQTLLALEGKLDGLRALGIMAPIASALDAAHATGLVHRDVNPANILIAPARDEDDVEESFLTDFGLSKNRSKDSGGLTAAGAFVGTFSYTAPEQILGRQPDHRADIYSLACVLYECLTARPPFENPREAMVLHAHIEDPPPQVTATVPELPVSIDAVIARGLAKDPAERYATCTEMIAAARVALTAGPTPSPAPPPPVMTPARPTPAPPASEGGMLLRVTAGPAAGEEIEVADELLIGRHATGPGRLGEDSEISRQHARVARGGAGYTIQDLGSTNGTFVDGRRIEQPEPLSGGEVIEVGGTTLVAVGGGTVAPVPGPVTEEVPAPVHQPTPPASRPPEEASVATASVRLDIDFDARTARLEVGEEAEAVVLVFEDGRWRPS
jgi:serine/threonine-protein kinase